MAFRVLIIGGRHFDYAALRDALDRLLANRLPDVEVLTAGVPALAASYATERGLTLTALTTDFARHRGNAEEWRDERLVSMAEAAVLVDDPTGVRRLRERTAAKGLRVAWVGGPVRRDEEPDSPRVESPRSGNLPD
jgi:hypothetical protein